MDHYRRYNINGLTVDIPLVYDGEQGIWLEDYADIIDNAYYTPEGYPIVICADDACRYADPDIHDCGSCRYYIPAGEKTLMGICQNKNNQKSSDEERKNT